MFLGVIGVFINQWSFFVGLQTADPTTSALILATTPIFNCFFSSYFLKEKLTIRMLMGLIVLDKPITGAEIFGSLFIVARSGVLSSTNEKAKYDYFSKIWKNPPCHINNGKLKTKNPRKCWKHKL